MDATTVEKFNGDNYASWSGYVHAAFLSKQVWTAVNYDHQPAPTSEDVRRVYVSKDNVAFGLLFLCMHADYHHVIIKCDEAWKGWALLKNLYQRQEKVGWIYLKRQLFSLKMPKGANALQHCNHALQLQAKLTSIGAIVEDEDVAICILQNLPKSFKTW